MPTITFEPMNVRADCAEGESVFAVAQRSHVLISTSCNAKATCGLCRVKVVAGEENLTPFCANEQKHLGNVYFITKERLSCQARVTGGDVTVMVPPLRITKKK